jgi:hypothetical protein
MRKRKRAAPPAAVPTPPPASLSLPSSLTSVLHSSPASHSTCTPLRPLLLRLSLRCPAACSDLPFLVLSLAVPAMYATSRGFRAEWGGSHRSPNKSVPRPHSHSTDPSRIQQLQTPEIGWQDMGRREKEEGWVIHLEGILQVTKRSLVPRNALVQPSFDVRFHAAGTRFRILQRIPAKGMVHLES